MTDTIHSCSPFCTLPACVKQRQRLEFEACCRVEGGINTSRDSTPPANGGNGEYLYACTNQAWWAWQAATERATAIERERCAAVCKNKQAGDARDSYEFQVGYNMTVDHCAKAMRQGGAE